MKVHIEGELYLESDDMQFMIRQYTGKVDKKGKELYNNLGYFTTIEGATNFMIKRKIKQSTATTLRELVQDIREIKQHVSTLLGS